MKSRAALGILLTLFMGSCGVSDQPMKNEALAFAKTYLDQRFLKCGESWWTCYANDPTSYTEWKGGGYYVSLSPPSEAEHMNGIECHAIVGLSFSAIREWSGSKPWDSSQPLVWKPGEWVDGRGSGATLWIMRKNGQWGPDTLSLGYKPDQPPQKDCSQLPKQ
jgi:hypothetical protein